MSGQFLPDFTDLNKSPLLHNPPNQNKSSSNVKVVCRIKPINQNEQIIDMKIDKQFAEISIPQPRQETTKTFTFNRIYTDQSQQDFVSQVCEPILKRALYNRQGYLIFSYGVTNSGKTHTILGNQNQPGILPYLVKRLSQKTNVYLSAIQLYNDDFFSLVNKEKLQPRQLGGFLDFDQCAIMEPINITNMDSKFRQFINNRTQNQTKLNAKSSRSHAIFRIKAGDVVIGVVDLAGSQRTNRVFASIDQTSNINKSLLCLGRCIKALNENPDSHLPIPYRQSKLTKVLIQYFAAKVQVLMIANINQSQTCFHENMKVLDYAVLAKDIRHCSTESSLKKSEFKFPKTNKVDVFESLYKSSSKSAFAHKSLKSSRSKINQKMDKSVKAAETNKKFARALKAQQLQLHIQKFDSSQQTFDYMVEYMHQKQSQDDKRRLLMVKNSQYQSPNAYNFKRQPQQIKQVTEVGVGRSQYSIELMKKQLCQKMKEQFKNIMQEQKLAKMRHQQTSIGQSLSKNYNKQQVICNNYEQTQKTPMKGKETSGSDENFIIKTSIAIYSSAKKVFSEKVHSIKNIWPSFKKASTKNHKLSFCNYNSLYEQLFKFARQPESRQSTISSISFDGKIKKHKQNKFITKDYQVQVGHQQFNNEQTKNTQETGTETDDQVLEYPQLHQVHFEAELKSNQKIDQEIQKQNKQINEDSEEESQSQKKDVIQKQQKWKKPSNRGRPKGANSKSRNKQAALRVAQMRKYAARMCREKSRTPLKRRLRNHKKE